MTENAEASKENAFERAVRQHHKSANIKTSVRCSCRTWADDTFEPPHHIPHRLASHNLRQVRRKRIEDGKDVNTNGKYKRVNESIPGHQLLLPAKLQIHGSSAKPLCAPISDV